MQNLIIIDIDKGILENIDIDKAILKNIDIDRKSLRNIDVDIDKGIESIRIWLSNRATGTSTNSFLIEARY